MNRVPEIQKELAATVEGSGKWGFLQMQLGDALLETDESPEAQEAAINTYRCAMSVYTFEQSPREWGQIAIRLGEVYLYRIADIRSRNLLNCIELSEKAIEVLPNPEFMEDWMIAQYNIGTAYLNLMTGDRSGNIETGIKILSALLLKNNETQWAMLQNQLGTAFLARIAGERAKNLEMAREYFNAALKVFTINTDPVAWAQTQTNLAAVYVHRISGERSENLEKAIVINLEIEEVFTRQQFPVEWAKTKANLSDAYRNRILGDKSQNMENAIDACNAALQVFTKKRFPLDWARNHIHLGNIYMSRIVGDPAQNIENAINAYHKALNIYDECKSEYPLEWGYSQISLGMAYRVRIMGQAERNDEMAITSYSEALKVFQFEKYPEEWARVQNNLGNVYVDSTAGDPAENIENAIKAFLAALIVLQKEKYPLQWAMTQNNLGLAYLSRRPGDPHNNRSAAVVAFKAALEIRTSEKLPAEFIRTTRALGEAYYQLENWNEALVYFRQSLNAADHLRYLATNVVSNLRLSQDMAYTFSMAIHSALMLGYVAEAAMLTIASKGRSLAERMNAIDIADAQLLESKPELISQMKRLLELEHKIKWGETEELKNQLRAERKEIIDRITVDYPALSTIRYFEPVTTEDIWRVIAACGGMPVLDYVQHEGGWGAFLYQAGEIGYIELNGPLFEKIEKVTIQIQRELFWKRPDYRQQLRKCYDLVFAPIRACLRDNDQLLICPSGILNQLPFQALLDEEDNYLCTTYAVSFIYGLSMLPVLLNNKPADVITGGDRLLNIAHPGSKKMDNIWEYVHAEMEAVAACFPQKEKIIQLFNDEARPEVILEKANNRRWDVIHINSHGEYKEYDPTRSGLHLQDGMLTIQDILLQMKLQGGPLVTLSACQTGQAQIQIGDENISLVSAFLIAGASATMSSLWKVPAAPTKLLMEMFHTMRREGGKTDAQVLQAAMAKIRSIDLYKNPDCWAAFQLTGLPQFSPFIFSNPK